MKFEEVLQALRNGKSIRRKDWGEHVGSTSLSGMDKCSTFWRTYIEADDWEIDDKKEV